MVEYRGAHGIEDLDARGACAAIAEAHQEQVAVECRQLELAAHWIDLHAPVDHPDAEPTRLSPGAERTVRVGADGTPEITEFAAAEFAALQEMHPLAGAHQLRKVANLRHRHPRLWCRVLAGQVQAWKALETGRLVGREELALDRDAARWIDMKTYEWISTLPWGQYLELVEKLIIEADPAGAEHRRTLAETEQFVSSTQSNEHGLKTLVAKAAAGKVLYLVAVVDRLADILAEHGDTRPVGVRRAEALTLLATPARALELLALGQQPATPSPDPDGTDHADDTGPEPEPEPEEEPEPEDEHPDGAASNPSFLAIPPDLAAVLARLTDGDRAAMQPAATLHVHLTREAFATGRGAATVEGYGAITVGQAAEWLGHRNVTVTEVLDPADQAPVDGYVFTPRLRDALHALNRRDVFPYGTNTGRRKDIDHPEPYVPPDDGGPPGQTGMHNAAPMVRRHHRLKTSGRWRLRQAEPGVYLWTSPHGYTWLVDPTGTYPLPAPVAAQLHRVLDHARDAQQAA